MAESPGDEKVADYCEAFLGLAWLEEQMQLSLGWGDMRKVYKFVAEELTEVFKKNAKDNELTNRGLCGFSFGETAWGKGEGLPCRSPQTQEWTHSLAHR